MPKKKFEDTPYDPIAADLAREVGATGRSGDAALSLSPMTTRAEKPQFIGNAVVKLEKHNHFMPQTKTKAPERTITKRFVVTRGEDDDLTAFLLRLQKKAGTKISLSVLTRAALGLAMQAEEQLLAEIGDKFSMELPSTQDPIAQAEYEDRWMSALANAFRKMPRQGRG